MTTPVNKKNENNLNYSLGLDIGTNSVGWSIVSLEGHQPKKLINLGSRVFIKAVNDKTPTPKNVARRTARSIRRVLARRTARCNRLENYLKKLNLLPQSLTKHGYDRESTLNDLGCPYSLRAKALDFPLEKFELGRVLLHLVQRRGFLSNKKTLIGDLVDDPDVQEALSEFEDKDENSKEASEYKQSIADLKASIADSGYRTLGEYLHLNKELSTKRNRALSPNTIITDRSMYLHELHLIWDKQSKHFDVLSEEVIAEIENIIFYQRPLRFKRNRVGKCTFEPNKKRCAKARLEYQQFRYLQDINNLQYIEAQTNRQKGLSSRQQASLVQLFMKYKSVSFTAIRSALGFDKTYTFNLERAENKKLKGDLTYISISKIIPDRWHNMAYTDKEALVEDLLSYQKKSALKKRLLSDRWNFSTHDAIQLCLLELEDGHGSLSSKAINKILPYLQTGMIYENALEAAGYSPESNIKPVYDLLPLSPDIPNPIVKRALSEIRRVVNAIVKEYGKPSVIRLEMAKELEMNTKKYKSYLNLLRSNTKENTLAENDWKAFNENNPKIPDKMPPDFKTKYRLWKDQHGLCAYSNRAISKGQLFSNSTVISHILPLSYSLDDSYMNKVVCFSEKNIEKGQRTPFEAFSASPEWSLITKSMTYWGQPTITTAPGKSNMYFKLQKFYMNNNDLNADNATASLNDTRYITKLAVDYLQNLGVPVSHTRSKFASKIRRDWGLNSILDVPDSDYRQHSIDATIIACTDDRFRKHLFEKIKTLEVSNPSVNIADIDIPEPFDGFHVQVKDKVLDMIVSHQKTSKTKGGLHEDTAYGFIENVGIVYRKPISPNFPVDKVTDPVVKRILEERLAECNGNKEKAFNSDNPVYHNDGVTPIRRARILKSKLSYEKLEQQKVGIKDANGRIFKWHSYGNNHCVRVFCNDGVYTSEYLSVMQAQDKDKRLSMANDDHQPIFTLYKSDIVSMLNEEGNTVLRRVIGINNTGKIVKLGLLHLSGKIHERGFAMNTENITDLQIKKVSVNVLGSLRGD